MPVVVFRDENGWLLAHKSAGWCCSSFDAFSGGSIFCSRRQGHEKRGPLSCSRLQPDAPMLPLDRPLRDREPQSLSRTLLRVQPAKEFEHLRLMFARDADPIVAHLVDRTPILHF